jgi:hypothetical protein
MTRKAHEQRDEAIEAMRRLSNEHGVREGCRLAREQFPSIATPTWNRWRIESVGHQPEQEQRDTATRAKIGREVRATIPDVNALAPAPIDVIPAQKRALDFWRLIDELDQDAKLMRDYAVTVQPDGTRKLRVPMALVNAHRMRADLIRLALEHASIAWSSERQREFQEAVIACVGEASRELQMAVISRLRKLKANNEAKYGI